MNMILAGLVFCVVVCVRTDFGCLSPCLWWFRVRLGCFELALVSGKSASWVLKCFVENCLAGVWFFCVVVCVEQIRVLVPVRLNCSDLQACWRVLAGRPLLASAVVVGTDGSLDVLGRQSGWVACFLVETGLFFGAPKGQLIPGFGWFFLCQRSVCLTWRDC